MKTLFLILVTAICSQAQISFTKIDYRETIVLKTDTMTVENAFNHLDMIVKGQMWYFNRVVEVGGKSYLRFGVPLFKRSTYVLENGKYRKQKSLTRRLS